MKYVLTRHNQMVAVVSRKKILKLVPTTAGNPDRGKPFLLDRYEARTYCRANPTLKLKPQPYIPDPLAAL